MEYNIKQMNNFESSINAIRDILRKNGITGQDSIKHCIVFVLCRYLDESKCELYGMDGNYSFDKFVEVAEDDENKLMEKFYNKTVNCFIGQLNKKLHFKMEFKLDNKKYLGQILKKLESIDIDDLNLNFDIIGTIYELHLKTGTDNSAMRDLGQYYSSRHIINYMIKLCDPKLKSNKKIESICDPTCGSGGFLSMSIRYLNSKYPNKIDWSTNKSQIYGFDITENNVHLTSLNLLLETGELFDTICKQDSLYNDLKNEDTNEILDGVDIILANEPFGLKNLVHASCCEKVKNLKIRGTKGEPLFLQLMSESLNPGGRCAVIVPEGVLFNDSELHKGTRKHLIEKYNLKKIVLMSDTFFMNTNVKCAVLYWTNDEEKTSQVEYYDIKYVDGEIKETHLLTVSKEQIKSMDYYLGINKYTEKEETKFSGVEYKKLGDICEFKSKSKRPASYGNEMGKYPFYTSSNILSKFCDEPDYTEECLIFGTGGNANVKISKNFSCSADNFIIKIKDVNTKYVYFWCLNNIDKINELFHGATIKHLSKADIENLEIPIPSLENQQQIVDALDLYYTQIESNKKSIEAYETFKKDQVNFSTINCATKSLGDICDIKGGKRLPKGETYVNNSDYYYLQVGDIDNKFTDMKFIDEKNYKLLLNYKLNKDDIVISIAGSIGKVGYFQLNKNVILTENACKCTNVSISKKYLYYILNSDESQKYFQNEYKQVTIPKLSLNNLSNLKIPIPSKEVQEFIVKTCEYWDQQIENLKTQNKMLESNQIIQTVLSSITKLSDQTIEEVNQDTYNETIEKFTDIVDSAQEELEEVIKPKKKSTKKTKTNEI